MAEALQSSLAMLPNSQMQWGMEISKFQAPSNEWSFGEPWPVLDSRRAKKNGLPSLEVGGDVNGFFPCKMRQRAEKSDQSVCAHGISTALVVASLDVCTKQKDLRRGMEIHTAFAEEGVFQKDVFVGNKLVHMYAKCGALANAQHVFDELISKNVFSWNVLIGGYVQHNQGEEALVYFEQMQREGFSPDAFTLSCVLKACGSIRDFEKGKAIHCRMARGRSLDKDTVVANALVDMYAKCGSLEKAQEVFDDLPIRDVVSWNMLIAGYAEHGQGAQALLCFKRMELAGFSPNVVTFVSTLKACGSIGALDMGKELHEKIGGLHLLEQNVLIGNALLGMYAKCGELEEAQKVFDKLPGWNVVSWNGLITAYVEHGHGETALKSYQRMLRQGFFPDVVTIICILKACGSIGDTAMGSKIHAQVLRSGLLEEDHHVGTALVDMYAKCGLLEKAEAVFEELHVWDVVMWNVLIAGYAQSGWNDEALQCFQRMQLEGFAATATTFACVLKACGNIGVVCKGQRIHDDLVQDELAENDMAAGTALVDMYANCGMLSEAQEVFNRLPVQNVVSWSALMVGFSQLGKEEAVAHLFDKMIANGIRPNSVTLMILLNSCSHRGLVDKGQTYIATVSKIHYIILTLEHYVCMIDLFSRAGCLNDAIAVLCKMPYCATPTAWHILLGACQKWGDVKVGRWAFDHAIQMDERDASAYDCMRNIYIAAGRYKDANLIEANSGLSRAQHGVGRHTWIFP